MKEFEPRPFQKEVFDRIKSEVEVPEHPYPLHMPRRFYLGFDVGQKGGDKSVITRAKINGKGQITQIVFDEFADMPDYKWYRNPIKWYKWRKLWKTVEKHYERIK